MFLPKRGRLKRRPLFLILQGYYREVASENKRRPVQRRACPPVWRRLATTSSFGHYRFADIESGGTYAIGVKSTRYRFTPRVIQIVDTLTDFNFVGLE